MANRVWFSQEAVRPEGNALSEEPRFDRACARGAPTSPLPTPQILHGWIARRPMPLGAVVAIEGPGVETVGVARAEPEEPPSCRLRGRPRVRCAGRHCVQVPA